MDEKKLHTREFQLKGIGRIQNLADALSLKYIKLFQKYSLYWFYAVLIFTSNLRDSPPPPHPLPPIPQQYNPPHQNKNF